ncbi:hypothetical protein GGS23DRAFT_567905 [Durotheca rogersii]|uniref:uncharacterized protein n=1 Tax=Durotheca rogersii TaxID=419775 RepID=UPI00221F34F7|nr:uncharacterized protein GGS23DRAFT_567905 [Durotheca rogersii]KAI5863035.1 hypothetical protein GGS23DRAFT_567905 [Durotheca rogersii]
MDHGPPPPPNPNSMFDFSAPASMNPMTNSGQNDLMSLYDSSLFANFEGLPMSIDGLGDVGAVPPPHFPPPSAAGVNPQAALVPNGAAPFASAADASSGPPPSTGIITPSFVAPPQPSAQGGSTLTEFTKRRNWPAKVIEELKDLLQLLDAHGRIKYVSPSVLPLTGYRSEELVDRFVKDLIHSDDVGTFTTEMNESIATGNPLRMFYRLKKKDGDYAIFESVGHAHIAAARFAPNPENQSPFCQAVFMMSRPYPTRNASLLDSFLEHKIENERLRRRIAELRREEEEEEASQQSWLTSQEGRSDITPSDDTIITSSQSPAVFTQPAVVDSQAMPPPERPTPLNIALTRENLEGVTAGNRPDSIRDKMARYEGASHTETIEMLTGLRYVEGERSRGITTGNSSPTLIKGDVGIAIPIDRDPRTGEKKKKIKIAEEYVCTDCGTLDSPEWRKGPSGPKTLCNACGLRWAKKEKKRNAGGGGGNAGPGPPVPMAEP